MKGRADTTAPRWHQTSNIQWDAQSTLLGSSTFKTHRKTNPLEDHVMTTSSYWLHSETSVAPGLKERNQMTADKKLVYLTSIKNVASSGQTRVDTTVPYWYPAATTREPFRIHSAKNNLVNSGTTTSVNRMVTTKEKNQETATLLPPVEWVLIEDASFFQTIAKTDEQFSTVGNKMTHSNKFHATSEVPWWERKQTSTINAHGTDETTVELPITSVKFVKKTTPPSVTSTEPLPSKEEIVTVKFNRVPTTVNSLH